jgi:hypothetical protein
MFVPVQPYQSQFQPSDEMVRPRAGLRARLARMFTGGLPVVHRDEVVGFILMTHSGRTEKI